ncbi:hypothetical protein ACH4FX_37055 [Streptomyces sp. NPDC018019]|uniref:hypothetical protein n=1 Tax=Streptomyces sp. NPDC018019 TaxID=3365030 RepID=UPI003793DAC5
MASDAGDKPDALHITSGPGTAWTADTPGLRPGDKVTRYLDVISGRSEPLTETATLWGTGRLTDGGGLRAGVEQCSEPWTGGDCPGVRTELAAPGTALNKAVDLGTRSAPPHEAQHLKLAFTVPADLPSSLEGTTARVTLKVTGTATGGDDHTDADGHGGTAGGTSGGRNGHGGDVHTTADDSAGTSHGSGGDTGTGSDKPGGALARTGADLWGLALLALGAIVAGVAAWSARRRTSEADQDQDTTAALPDGPVVGAVTSSSSRPRGEEDGT